MASDDLSENQEKLLSNLAGKLATGLYNSEFRARSSLSGWVIDLYGKDGTEDEALSGFTKLDLMALANERYITFTAPDKYSYIVSLESKAYKRYKLGSSHHTILSRISCLFRHQWGEWEAMPHKKHKSQCSQRRSCKRCGQIETRKTEHDWSPWKISKQKCEKSRVCQQCQEIQTGEVVPHNWGNWQKQKNCEKYRLCQHCSEKETGEIEHNWSEWATSQENSCSFFRKCETCSKTETKTKHDFAPKFEGTKHDDNDTLLQCGQCQKTIPFSKQGQFWCNSCQKYVNYYSKSDSTFYGYACKICNKMLVQRRVRMSDNLLINNLFKAEYDGSWDALRELEKNELKENEIGEICRLLLEGQGSRPPIDLLKRIGNPDCLSALLHVINERHDFGELDFAKDAMESIIRRNPNGVGNDDLKKIMTLPNKEGSVSYQSDSSWDTGHREDEIVDLDGLRKLARTSLNAKENAKNSQG